MPIPRNALKTIVRLSRFTSNDFEAYLSCYLYHIAPIISKLCTQLVYGVRRISRKQQLALRTFSFEIRLMSLRGISPYQKFRIIIRHGFLQALSLFILDELQNIQNLETVRFTSNRPRISRGVKSWTFWKAGIMGKSTRVELNMHERHTRLITCSKRLR